MATVTVEVLLLCVQLPLVTCISCWRYNIEHCNSFVKPYITQAAIKYYTRPQLELFCRAKPTYDACVDAMQPSCQPAVRLQLQGAQDSNDYLCSVPGFRLMLAHSPCYKSPRVQGAARACDAQLRRKLPAASTRREKCHLAEQYLYCVEDGIAEVCGPEAGHFVYEANVRVLRPLYRDIGCHLGTMPHDHDLSANGSASGHVTGAASVWVVTVVTAVVGLLASGWSN